MNISCTSLLILLFIKFTVYCPAHFILLHILFFLIKKKKYIYIYFFTYIYVYSLVLSHILHCPLSEPDLIYISLLIIFCIIEYVTNKTLNLKRWVFRCRLEIVRDSAFRMGSSFHQPGTVKENVMESDFVPLCNGTTRRRSLADLRLLEGM